MTNPKEATREALPADLEALMPEPFSYPVGDVTGPCVCGSWPGGKCLRCAPINFFTADQVREAMLAAHISALEDAYNAMFDLKGDKVTRFDAQTAIRKLKDAAAIRSGGEAG